MATVTGFEGLRHARKADLKQFSELFAPLFLSSSDEARRQAAAALSQCPHVPEAVALLIGSAPIAIAAIFLTRSTSIADETLMAIIRAQSPAHATAIARRENLSPQIVDTLVERRQTLSPLPQAQKPIQQSKPVPQSMTETVRIEAPQPVAQTDGEALRDRHWREEHLRRELKALALTNRKAATPAAQLLMPVLMPIDSLHEALLVRFARSGEINLFTASLAAALDASPSLGERIVLDISGQQLAATLSVLALNRADHLFILETLYPHLGERQGGATRADVLIETTSAATSRERVEAWLRADRYTGEDASHAPHLAADRTADPRQPMSRPVATGRVASQSIRRSFGR